MLDLSEFEKCKQHLLNGGILAYPTETVWGFGVLPSHKEALKRLDQLKERKKDQSYSLLITDIEMAKQLTYVSQSLEKVLQVFWPGPVTFVLKAQNQELSKNIGGKGFIGLRCSNHSLIKQFMLYLNQPLVTTSANKSGKPTATKSSDLDWIGYKEKEFKLLTITEPLDHPEIALNIPSTVIKIEEPKGLASILRKGTLSEDKIYQVLNNCGVINAAILESHASSL